MHIPTLSKFNFEDPKRYILNKSTLLHIPGPYYFITIVIMSLAEIDALNKPVVDDDEIQQWLDNDTPAWSPGEEETGGASNTVAEVERGDCPGLSEEVAYKLPVWPAPRPLPKQMEGHDRVDARRLLGEVCMTILRRGC